MVEPSETMKKLVDEVQREVRRRLGPSSTFEQRRAAAAALMAEALTAVTEQVDEGAQEDQAQGHRQRR